MNVLHQATDSVTGQTYTWVGLTYDHGAGYPGPNSPENILVTAGLGPGRDAGASPSLDQVPALRTWVQLADGSAPFGAKTTVSVDWPQFGATGDGVTDDTAACQAAIDYIVALGGGTVDFPEGNYRLTEPLWVSAGGVHIRGVGDKSRIFVEADDGIAILFDSVNDIAGPPTGTLISGFELSHIKVEGTGVFEYHGLAYGRLILGRNVANVHVHDCTISGASMIGVCVEGTCGYSAVINCRFIDCKYTAINFNGAAHGSLIQGNKISGTNANMNACAIQATGHCVVIGNTIHGDATNPANSNGILWGEGSYHGLGLIDHNYIFDCGYGIKGFVHGPAIVTCNLVVGCYGSGGGIMLYGGTFESFAVSISHWVVANNLVINCAPYGIQAAAERCVINSNIIRNILAPVQGVGIGLPGYIQHVTWAQAGIAVQSDGVTVVGNLFDGGGMDHTVGISITLGVTPGAIGSNTAVGCNGAVSQDNTGYPFFNPVDCLEHVQTSDGWIYRVTGNALPTTGYYSTGSVWTSSAANPTGARTARVRSSADPTTTATAAAGDTLIEVTSTVGMGVYNVVGVLMSNYEVHWSVAVMVSPTQLQLMTAIPATRDVASGAAVYITCWESDLEAVGTWSAWTPYVTVETADTIKTLSNLTFPTNANRLSESWLFIFDIEMYARTSTSTVDLVVIRDTVSVAVEYDGNGAATIQAVTTEASANAYQTWANHTGGVPTITGFGLGAVSGNSTPLQLTKAASGDVFSARTHYRITSQMQTDDWY